METTHPLKLEIISLQLSDISDEDFLCSISLMKGMQNFGQIKFQIDRQLTSYVFNDLNIIKFFYTPRLATRRDVFFKIILTDLQSSEQMGQIPISTHLLADTFKQDKNAIIECKSQFFQGVSLVYKIYQPQFQLKSNQITYGFQAVKKNDFISSIFARPEVPKINLSSVSGGLSKLPEPSPQIQKTQSIIESQSSQKKKKPEPLEALNILGAIFSKPKQQSQQNLQQTRKRNNSVMKISHAKVSGSKEGLGEDLIAKLLGHIRQSKLREQQKKYSLTASNHHGHHNSHGMSKKIKVVLMLLIFGLFMIFADMLQDTFIPPKELKKSKKNLKKKIKVGHH